MDVVPSLLSDAQATEAVQPGDRPFNDIAEDAKAGAVFLSSFGDERLTRRETHLPAMPLELDDLVARECLGFAERGEVDGVVLLAAVPC